MEFLTDNKLVPQEKFRHIKGLKCNEVFEFKKDRLRVYVVKRSPQMLLILGGYKTEQENDIKRISNWLKEFE